MGGIHVTTNVELLEISWPDPVSLLQLLNGEQKTHILELPNKNITDNFELIDDSLAKDGTCKDQKSNIVELPKNKLMLESRNIKPTGVFRNQELTHK